MKITYFILLCCFCLASCHSKAKNKEMKSDLNLSLLFYPSMSIGNFRYSIDIINDSLIVKNKIIDPIEARVDSKEERIKLTDYQIEKIKKMTSVLSQKYDRSKNFVKGGWGCTLKVNDQVYYEENYFSLVPRPKEKGWPWQPPPEEIKLLIDYIVSLSPIPIELYGFS